MSVASFGLGTIRSTLYLDTQQYRMALQQATGMTRKAVAENNKILALQSGSANVGMAAAMGATIVAPMIGMVNKIQQVYGDYEKVLAKTQVVSKATDQAMKALSRSFIENGKAFGETPTNMAKAGYASAQAMFTSFKEMKKIAEASAKLKLASGGEITTEQSAESLTRMLQAFSLGVSQVDEINDVLLRTRDVGAVSMDALADSVRNVASAYAQAFPNRKMESFKEMMALMASGTQAGMAPSVMATGLRGMLARVYTESNQPKSAMNALAVSKGFQNAAAMMKDGAIPFLRIVKDASGGYLELLNALGYERREMSGVAAVIRGGMKNTEEAYQMINNSAGAIDEASLKMKKTWDYVKNVYASTKEAMMIAFGPAVIKMLLQIAEAFTKVFSYLEKLPESTKELIVMAGAFTVLRVAVSALGGALQIMGVRWASIIPGMTTALGLINKMGGTSAVAGAVAGAGGAMASMAEGAGVASMGALGATTYSNYFGDVATGAGTTSGVMRAKNIKMPPAFESSYYRGGYNSAKANMLGALLSSGILSGTPSSGMLGGTPSSGALGGTPSSMMKQMLLSSGKMSGTPSSGMMGAFSGRRVSGAGMDTLGAMFLSLFGNKILSSGKMGKTPSSNMVSKIISSGNNVGRVTNRSVSGFGMDSLIALFSRFFGNRTLSSGAMMGTPSSGMMRGLGGISSGMMMGTPSSGSLMGTPSNKLAGGLNLGILSALTAMSTSAVDIVKKMAISVTGFFTSMFNTATTLAKSTATAIASMWGTSVLPGAQKAGKAVAGGTNALMASSWATALGQLLTKFGNLASKTGLITLAVGALTGAFLVLKELVLDANTSFAEIGTSIWEGFETFFKVIGYGFAMIFEGIIAFVKTPWKGWDATWAGFQEKMEKHQNTLFTVPQSKKPRGVYFTEEAYFKDAVDKMVKEMSPDGTMAGLDNETRKKIIDTMMSMKHSFKLFGEDGKGIKSIKDFQLYDLGMLIRVAWDLFKQDKEETPDTQEEAVAEGLPQFAEEIKMKLGEIAEAFTLGSAEAWKAIMPRYYVEEKSLKNQKEQLKLSSEQIKVSGEIRDNTAKLGSGGTIKIGSLAG